MGLLSERDRSKCRIGVFTTFDTTQRANVTSPREADRTACSGNKAVQRSLQWSRAEIRSEREIDRFQPDDSPSSR